ncbi:MAG: Spy/CpxP family protein refolding chaperone [Planctomycetaceae bacterium]
MKIVGCVCIFLAASGALASLVVASESKDYLSPEIFPLEFLLIHREALGLSDKQVDEVEAICEKARPQLALLGSQLEQRVIGVRDAMQAAEPDLAVFEKRVREALAVETEYKVLEGKTLYALRMKLTPEQIIKAREIRQQFPATGELNPKAAIVARLDGKLRRFEATIREWQVKGRDASAVGAIMEEFVPLMKAGRLNEAEAVLDRALKALGQDPVAKSK